MKFWILATFLLIGTYLLVSSTVKPDVNSGQEIDLVEQPKLTKEADLIAIGGQEEPDESVFNCSSKNSMQTKINALMTQQQTLIDGFEQRLAGITQVNSEVERLRASMQGEANEQENNFRSVSQMMAKHNRLLESSISNNSPENVKAMIKAINDNKNRKLSREGAAILKDYIEQKDFTGLRMAFDSNQFDKQSYLDGDSIFSYLVKNNTNMNLSDWENIQSLELPLSLDDYILLTKLKVDNEVFKLFPPPNNSISNQVWKENGKLNSLITIALKNLNLAGLHYWLTQEGVNKSDNISLYSHIPVIDNDQATDTLQAMVGELIQNGYVVINITDYLRLLGFFTDKQLELLEINRDGFTEEEFYEMSETKKALLTIDSEIKSLQSFCDEQIRSAEFIESNTTYVGKTKELTNSMHLSEVFSVDIDKRYIRALKSNNWSEILEILNQLDLDAKDNEQMLNAVLYRALVTRAEFDVIKGILEQGAQLPENAVIILASQGNFTLIKSLEKYGLDLFYSDSSHMNAVDANVKYMTNTKLIDYLAAQGLNFNNSSLSFALLKYQRGDKRTSTIANLLKHGVVIDESHLEQVEKIKKNDETAYKKLIKTFPVLMK
ncbi:hypothetical protein [Thalassotalea marina]|uniref:Ankyrin repeat domain-containing protein n=1 Tax=Thalassotalea marina TaxID=1673741 RepID=A0A919ENW3_9GAMM|nr:hypothetical protein [Thalassotalea marina]GHG04241.1 hypothetical protein GCM10017161_37170 [Thalassotalea marina]